MNGTRQQLIFSLGGNESSTEDCFTRSIDLLSSRYGEPTHLSSIYTSEAWGFESKAPPFLNQIVAFETEEEAESILAFSQHIEKSLGRKNKSDGVTYTNRPIDIDLLTYGTTHIATTKLTIPHPLMHKRNFILVPLAEIFPNFIHPTLKKTLKELLLSNQDNLSVKVHKK